MSFRNKSYRGVFTPTNPAKYKGDVKTIIYRSSWELRLMKHFDKDPSILWWSSEELAIPYMSPVDGKKHRYFPDFVAKMIRKDGTIMTYVIEVKPKKQTQKPTQKRQTKRFLEEAATYVVNQMKWKAADEFCQEHGWKFQILTEEQLGLT